MSVAISVSSAPAIATYDDLIAAIASALDRDDLTATEIPLFIAHAEREFNRLLRVRQMRTIASIAATARDVTLPTDLLKLVQVERADGTRLFPVTLSQLARYSTRTDVEVYAQIGGVPPVIRLAPTPSDETLDVIYLAKIPSLSADNQSNWLLASHHDVYYFMALAHAEAWLSNDERAAIWRQAADLVIGEIADADRADRDTITDTLATEFPSIMPRYMVANA